MKWLALALGLLMVAGLATGVPWDRVWRGQNDFLAFYCGAKLAGTEELHSAGAMKRLQLEHANIWMPPVLYIRPDFYAVLLKPLSWLPYRTAYGVFQAVNLAALLAFLFLFRERVAATWMAAVSVPLMISFVNGQDVPLVLFCWGMSIVMLRRGNPVLAGLFLALCTLKFQFFVFVPIALILWRKWRMAGAASVGVAALTAIGALAQGWDWILRYPGYLMQPVIHPETTHLMNLRGLVLAVGVESRAPLVFATLATAAAVCWLLWRMRGQNLEEALAVCLLAGMLVGYHIGMHDCALLLAVLVLWAARSRLTVATAALCAPPVYFLLLADGWVGAIPALGLSLLLGFSAWEIVRRHPVSDYGK